MSDYPALLRASDLIGQLADLNYMRKVSGLFAEFEETGMNEKLGYASSAALRAAYPKFFWSVVSPYVSDALSYLSLLNTTSDSIRGAVRRGLAEQRAGRGAGPTDGAANPCSGTDAFAVRCNRRRRRQGFAAGGARRRTTM